MKIEEIQAGSNVKRSSCSGSATLGHICETPHTLSQGCEKPENLHVCEKPENLSVKALSERAKGAPGSICCGGGTLYIGAGETSASGTCDSKTDLCSGDDHLVK